MSASADHPARQFNRTTMDETSAPGGAWALISDVERGLAQGEFFFVFQPKIRLRDRRLTGFECLIRWRHPVCGILVPASFISIVEDSRLTAQFTELLLTNAVNTLAQWKYRGHGGLSLSINLPAAQLGQIDLPARLNALLATQGVQPSGLQIELTEVVEPGRLDWLVDVIDTVQSTGVSVALDDFGAGFTSLTLLHQLPVSTLKFDRSLIARVPSDSEATVIVETLVRLGQRHGKQIVLEGVETATQFAWAQTLPDIECQGFYISEPVEEDAIEGLLARQGEAFGFV